MPELEPAQIVFLAGVGLYTLIAACTDLWLWKIPNKLTVPTFVLGFVYQIGFHGWNGFLDGLFSFLIGFGVFFLFFAIGLSGGGDVKFAGALSVWLGRKLLLPVMTLTTILVAFILVAYFVVMFFRHGRKGMRKILDDSESKGETAKRPDRRELLAKRHQGKGVIQGFAIPMGIATWAVVLWKLPIL